MEEQYINEEYLKITAVQSGIRIISSNKDFSGVIGKSHQTSTSDKLL